MGVIKEQSFKRLVVNLSGVFIGMISVLFIYSLDDDIYGYAQFLTSSAVLLVPFASIGAVPSSIRYFAKYKESKKGTSSLLSLMLMVTFLGFIGFSAMVVFFQENFYQFIDWLKLDSELVRANINVLLALTLMMLLVNLCTAFASNYHKVVIPSLVSSFAYKLYLPSIVLCYYFSYIGRSSFAFMIVAFYFVAACVLFAYLYRINALKLSRPSFISNENKRSMLQYFLFGGLNSIGSTLAFRIDAIMLAVMLSPASAGLYAKILFISNVISLPRDALQSIVNPIVSESWEFDDRPKIKSLYQRSSLNLFVIGISLFIILYFALDGLIHISAKPESFQNAKTILIYLAFAKIADLISSVSNGIISFSKAYKFNLIFILILGICNLFFNYYLIGEFNVIGAAMATCASFVIFNLIKLVFIYLKYEMNPLSMNMFKMLLWSAICFAAAYWIHFDINIFFLSMVKSGLVAILLAGGIYFFNLAPDLKSVTNNFLIQIKLKSDV